MLKKCVGEDYWLKKIMLGLYWIKDDLHHYRKWLECVRNVTKHPVWNNENQWYLIFPGCFACYLHGQWQSFVIELFIPLRHVKRARNSRVRQFSNVNTSLKNELVMYLWTIEKCNLIKMLYTCYFQHRVTHRRGFFGVGAYRSSDSTANMQNPKCPNI